MAAALVFFVGNATGSAAFSKQNVSIPMDDGVSISGTLYVPDEGFDPKPPATQPTRAEVEAARAMFDEMLTDFAFEEDADPPCQNVIFSSVHGFTTHV